MEGKELIKKRFGGNLVGYDSMSVVQRAVCAKVDSLMKQYVKDVPEGLYAELGAGTGFMTEYLLNRYSSEKWLINDLVPATEVFLSPIIDRNVTGGDVEYVWGDAETLRFGRNAAAMVVSASVFQWFDRLDTFLKNIYEDFVSGGYLVFSSFGEDNFYQIREASDGKKGIRFPAYDDVARWIEDAGYEILYREYFKEDMYFRSVRDMLEYMKHTGVNGTSDGRWTRSEYMSFCRKYNEMFCDGDRVRLTYNPFIFIARKPLSRNKEDMK